MKLQQRKALVKLALLAFGWPLALNHFYEGNTGAGVLALILTVIAWVSIVGIILWIWPFFAAVFNELHQFEGSDD